MKYFYNYVNIYCKRKWSFFWLCDRGEHLYTDAMIYLSQWPYRLIRKPADIGSVPWTTASIFDILRRSDAEDVLKQSIFLEQQRRSDYGIVLSEYLGDTSRYSSELPQDHTLHEWLLCNRLDLATRGYLIFVDHRDSKEHYLQLQTSWHIQKSYLARVVWDIRYWLGDSRDAAIDTPMMHHLTDQTRMQITTVHHPKAQPASTHIHYVHYDISSNTSIVRATITKGIRHQIRVHLSSIWHPIVGDILYGAKGNKEGGLWLVSIWVDILS